MIPLYDHNPSGRTPLATWLLIAINTAAMLWLATLSPLERQVELSEHGFVPARIAQLRGGEKLEVPITAAVPARDRFGREGQVLKVVKQVELPPSAPQILGSLLTTMFLHGGWMHLAGNMWFLWVFGNNVEARLGSLLYLGLYLVGGLLATACHWAYDPRSVIPVVGASGAVSTVLGAYAVTFPKATVSTLIFFGFVTVVEIPALAWLGIWFGGQLLDALAHRDLGVAVWAHIGGFVAGVILMPILADRPPPAGTSQDIFREHLALRTSDDR